MVLGLATAGDLQKALNKSPDEKLSEDRTRFYVAEIVLALSYLHQLGLMYRDLKPNNVLLNDDGHIQLVDLGGVADEHGLILGKTDEAIGSAIPLIAQNFAKNGARNAYAHAIDEAVVEEEAHVNVNGTHLEPVDDKQSSSSNKGDDDKKPKRKLSIMGTFG
jgi:serine/threonine protein kinase